MAKIISTEGLPSCRLDVDALSEREMLRIKDATCDICLRAIIIGLKFNGKATLNSKSLIYCILNVKACPALGHS